MSGNQGSQAILAEFTGLLQPDELGPQMELALRGPRPRNISKEPLNHFNFVGFHLGWCSCDPVQWLWPDAKGSI